MAKEAFYFTHDYGSRNDPKMQKVLMKMGHEGKSVYWDLVEMLYEEGGYLKISECENYAFALRTNETCITNLINDYDLFQKNEVNFWSDSILRRLDKRDDKSKKASESAKTRWEKANALKNDANAPKNDAIKERIGKEIKDNSITNNTLVGLGTRPAGVDRCEKYVIAFNGIKKSKYTATKDVKAKFKVAIKKYTPDQILSVLKSALKDPKHIESNCMYVTPEFVLREDIIERYLNAKPLSNFSDNRPVFNDHSLRK